MKYCLLVVTCFLSTNGSPLTPEIGSRIYDGNVTTIESYPYQVAIEESGSQVCGGAIVSVYHVLTAAHCVEGLPGAYRLRAGSSLRESGGSEHVVLGILRHEQYGRSPRKVPLNDIALLQVSPPFVFDATRQPIQLFYPGESSIPGSLAEASGWGLDEHDAQPRELHVVRMPIVDKAECDRAYKAKYDGLPDGYICAGYLGLGGNNTCNGDSGGPLVIGGRLAGIVSWAYECALPDYPTAFTEVARYRDWIDRNTNVFWPVFDFRNWRWYFG